MLNSAPIVPSAVLAPKASLNAGLPDPLAVGAIAARPNTLSAIQAGAQVLALKEMADKGDSAAQFDMGARLVEGRGLAGIRRRRSAGSKRRRRRGWPRRNSGSGAIYEKGLGVPRDAVKARECYEKAAALGQCARDA